MSTEVYQRDDLVTLADHFLPILVLVLVEAFRHDLPPILAEPHDLLTNRAGPARLLFMEVIEHPHPCASIAIIGYSFGEDRDEGGLAGIHIAYHSYLY